MKKIIVILALVNIGCAAHVSGESKYVYVETQKRIAIPYGVAGTSSIATKKEIKKLGYVVPSVAQVESFNRLEAQCYVTCGNHIIKSGSTTFDNRSACKESCLRADGWELFQLPEAN